jgi:hypothetical protein
MACNSQKRPLLLEKSVVYVDKAQWHKNKKHNNHPPLDVARHDTIRIHKTTDNYPLA